MRRSDREIQKRNIIDEIIRKSEICYMSMFAEKYPYTVPLNFGYDGKYLYFHCAKIGRKIDCIKQNNHVCIALTSDMKLHLVGEPQHWTTKYRSVIIEGEAEIVRDPIEKMTGMNKILNHYSDVECQFPKKIIDNVMILRVKIINITGKENWEDRE